MHNIWPTNSKLHQNYLSVLDIRLLVLTLKCLKVSFFWIVSSSLIMIRFTLSVGHLQLS